MSFPCDRNSNITWREQFSRPKVFFVPFRSLSVHLKSSAKTNREGRYFWTSILSSSRSNGFLTARRFLAWFLFIYLTCFWRVRWPVTLLQLRKVKFQKFHHFTKRIWEFARENLILRNTFVCEKDYHCKNIFIWNIKHGQKVAGNVTLRVLWCQCTKFKISENLRKKIFWAQKPSSTITKFNCSENWEQTKKLKIWKFERYIAFTFSPWKVVWYYRELKSKILFGIIREAQIWCYERKENFHQISSYYLINSEKEVTFASNEAFFE